MTDTELDTLWKTIKGELEIIANPSHVKTHLPGTYIKTVNTEDKLIEFSSPSDFQRIFIEDRMYGHLKMIVGKLLGSDYHLMFSVTKKEPTRINNFDLGPLFKVDDIEDSYKNKVKQAGLNERYTFDRYVVGNHNRLAYAVSLSISEDPGTTYNPFFLYSGVGLGKTHLVQSIGCQILKKHPNKKVMYKTGEQFLNEVIEALRKGVGGRNKMNDLKNLYRNLDVLIIDDIHAIAGKETTQEEFFHTFNSLYMARKQIILTSDRAPYEIKTLESRLSSRFASGMIADMQAPDVETKLAILKDRNDEMKLDAPMEVLMYLANNVNTNVRELEAKLLQTVTVAKSLGLDLNEELSSSILGQIDKQNKSRVTPNSILKEVTKFYGVTIKDLKGNRRTKNLVIPRQVVMYLLRDMVSFGFQAIGEVLGNRDHSTIIHGVDKVIAEIKTNQKFFKEIEMLKTNINNSTL